MAVALALPSAVFALVPNDSDYSRQWYLPKIGMPAAWDFTRGGDIVVAVLDTGVDMKHPELAANIWTNPGEIPGNGVDDDKNGYIDDIHGWNFVERTNDPSPQWTGGWTEAGITHGTVIAGIIGAVGNNTAGIAGINWRVKIMPLRILDSQGTGDAAVAAQAIDYATRNGARVLNFSFVTEEHNIGLDEAVARAARAGVLVVSAAGNNRSNNGDNLDTLPMYPVCSDGIGTNYIVGVASTDENDVKSDFSNYGADCVDISAPGTNITSTQLYNPSLMQFNSFTRSGWSGTSVASPMIAGVAALLLAANPGLSRETLLAYMTSTADPIDAQNPLYRGQLGAGRVNADRAVRAALGLPVAVAQVVEPEPVKQLSSYVALGANAGAAPEVRVYAADGTLYSKFMAYAPTFTGGVRVATGDLDGDGKIEIVTGAGIGGGPHVRVFDVKGTLKYQFFAYGTAFRGGVSVAAGDVDGDGKAEIITGAGPGGGPHVRVFGINGALKGQFFAYATKVTTGVNVAAGDLNRDGMAEIVAAPASAAGSQPVIYFKLENGFEFLGQITFLATAATGGVSATVADVGGDGNGDIILARTVYGSSVTVILSGLSPRTPFTVSDFKGMALSSVDLNADGRAEIVASPNFSGKLKLLKLDGTPAAGLNVTVPFAVGASVSAFSTATLR